MDAAETATINGVDVLLAFGIGGLIAFIAYCLRRSHEQEQRRPGYITDTWPWPRSPWIDREAVASITPDDRSPVRYLGVAPTDDPEADAQTAYRKWRDDEARHDARELLDDAGYFDLP